MPESYRISTIGESNSLKLKVELETMDTSERKSVNSLVDSGANREFIDREYAKSCQFNLLKLTTPVTVADDQLALAFGAGQRDYANKLSRLVLSPEGECKGENTSVIARGYCSKDEVKMRNYPHSESSYILEPVTNNNQV